MATEITKVLEEITSNKLSALWNELGLDGNGIVEDESLKSNYVEKKYYYNVPKSMIAIYDRVDDTGEWLKKIILDNLVVPNISIELTRGSIIKDSLVLIENEDKETYFSLTLKINLITIDKQGENEEKLK